jgi:5-(carboxyamino)imidazole ribonucleotide synthase
MVMGLNKVPTSFSMSIVIEDEKDDIKAKYSKYLEGRMGASDLRFRISIGTQRLHGTGQNKEWQDGSQGVFVFDVGDGKTIRPETDLARAHDEIAGAPAVLEGFVAFEREVSVVAARSPDGAFAAYDLCANTHRNHILDITRVPAGVARETEAKAREIAASIAQALDYVGVFAVELFLVRNADGTEELLVNEIAPRVHNSGHWTDFGAATSQFEQHVRAVCGWPLGSCETFGAVEMVNLIGEDVSRWGDILCEPQARLTLYGKAEARPGRKMGHVTYLR